MEATVPHDVTRLLRDLAAGDGRALDALLPLVYDQLRDVARQQRRRWSGATTLDTSALAHEAYLRFAQGGGDYRDRAHFLAVAARAVRQILVNYAEARRADKRGGGAEHVALDPSRDPDRSLADPASVLALDEALRRLERVSPRECRIVECRVFAGMTVDETAEATGVSPATVKRGWALAQAWLHRELG